MGATKQAMLAEKDRQDYLRKVAEMLGLASVCPVHEEWVWTGQDIDESLEELKKVVLELPYGCDSCDKNEV